MTSDAPVPAKVVPRMVGRYHLLEEVGRGTFGPLHLARFEGPNGFQRWTSVLEVESRFARDPEFRDAFFQSARTAARILHPNVAATLDVGETEGMLWLASEYLLGETAKELLTAAQQAKTPVPWDIACRIAADAALGLDAIHELAHATSGAPMNLVHGRLAPHRLVVMYDGAIKILEPSAPFVGLSAGEPGQTKMMVGRAVAYTAPELLRGEMFDRRADIFSLGVILWELSAGRRLFGGRDERETRAKIQGNVVPPLSEAVRGFPAAVEALILQAISPDPSARMATAKAFARALHQVLVKDSLVVTDDEVARYLSQVFPDRLTRKKDRLLTAADVTHVFNREALRLSFDSSSGPSPLMPAPRQPGRPFPSMHKPVARAREAEPFVPLEANATSGDITVRRRLDAIGPVMLFVVLGVAVAVIAVLAVIVVRRSPTVGPTASEPTTIVSSAGSASSASSSSSSGRAASASPPVAPAPSLAASSSASVDAASVASAVHTSRPAPTQASAPRSGRLTVICDPACDDVLDGRMSLGPSPIYKRSTSVGTHHITLRVTDPPAQKVVDVVVNEGDVTVLKQSMGP